MRKVKLKTIDNVTNFCNVASSINGNVTVTSGRYVVNGKSILGILSLTLGNFLEVSVTDASYENEDNFWRQLSLMGIETTEA